MQIMISSPTSQCQPINHWKCFYGQENVSDQTHGYTCRLINAVAQIKKIFEILSFFKAKVISIGFYKKKTREC